MNEEKRAEIIKKAMIEATKVLGCDPAYYGEEGEREVDKQLEKMGYNLEDLKK